MKSYLKYYFSFPPRKRHIAKNLLMDPEYRAEMFSNDVCNEILRKLDKENKTASDLAKKLGETRSAISQKLSGNPNIKLSTLFKLAGAVGVTISLPTLEECNFEILSKSVASTVKEPKLENKGEYALNESHGTSYLTTTFNKVTSVTETHIQEI